MIRVAAIALIIIGFVAVAAKAQILLLGAGPGALGASVTQARVTFQARPAAVGMKLDHASICVQSTTYNCASAPVELLFSGAHGFNIAAGATITSDWANIVVSSSAGTVYTKTLSSQQTGWAGYSVRTLIDPVTGNASKLVVIMDWNSVAGSDSDAAVNEAGTNGYYLAATASYNQQSPAGSWTAQGFRDGVNKVETQ